jgi:type II secretory pathway component GspD/PulD (secretin)
MKWFNLSPSMQAFPLLSILLLQTLSDARAATAPEVQRPPPLPQTTAPDKPNNPPAAPVPPVPNNFIVQAVPLNHRPAAEIKKILAPLVTPGGAVLEQPGGKALTIVDSPANLEYLLAIKELIDAPVFVAVRSEIFEPKTASAEELAAGMIEVMRSYILSTARSDAALVEVIPFPRTNQLLAVSTNETAWNDARQWLERIDAAAAPPRRIFIYPVEPGKAAELAVKLNQAKAAAPRSTFDSVTGSLVIYGTAKEFEEIKKNLSGSRQMEEFRQRLSALRQRLESDATKKLPPVP